MAMNEPRTQPRIQSLDALRGLALFGILVVNITQLADMSRYQANIFGLVVDLGFAQRFFPIFSFLFGVGFAIFLESAGRWARRPRLVLLRRLLILLAFGIPHALVHPGEALTVYAVVGLVVLLPASYLPRAAVLGLGVAVTAAAVVYPHGGLLVVAGLFLLGMAVARFGWIQELDRRPAVLVAVLAAGVIVAVPSAVWYLNSEAVHEFHSTPRTLAGLATATAYCALFLLLARTRPGAALHRVLAPFGRMALTNYVTATPISYVAINMFDLYGSIAFAAVFPLAAAIVAVQIAFSAWWLSRFRYGPLEWLWRRGTRRQAVPNRLRPAAGNAPRRPRPQPAPDVPHPIRTLRVRPRPDGSPGPEREW